jgi:hypothetical protein
MLARKVLNETKDALELTNRSVIEVNVANPRQTRGYTLAGVICDEIAFWPIDELSPKRDEDTLAALRPALLTLPHSKLIAITSPYARRGAAWNAYRKHFGQDASKVLVWQAPTLVMNPSADETAIAQAYEDDPDSAAAEYGAGFRRDIAANLSQEVIVPWPLGAISGRQCPWRAVSWRRSAHSWAWRSKLASKLNFIGETRQRP